MAIYKSEDIIGWESKNGEFLCCDCFDKKNEDSVAGWAPAEQNEDYLYICDGCNQRV